MNAQKKSIFMQMHNGTRTGEGSFNVALKELFYKADICNKRKLVQAFPDFFGDEVPEFGITKTGLIDRLRQNDKDRFRITNELSKSGTVDATIDERCEIPSAFLWRYLKHPKKSPTSLRKEFEDFSLFPEFSLAFLLESKPETLRHAAHLTIDQSEDNILNFCISGQISLIELRKICESLLSDSPCENK